MEKEKILEALKTIREVCEENEACKTCPLRDNGYSGYFGCMFDDIELTPSHWTLNTEAPTFWRAFVIDS